jgi:hypothetical protein
MFTNSTGIYVLRVIRESASCGRGEVKGMRTMLDLAARVALDGWGATIRLCVIVVVVAAAAATVISLAGLSIVTS